MAALNPPIQFADADVFHSRLRPNGLRFRYRVLTLFVDIDRLNENTGIPFFSIGRWNVLGFNPADHGPRDGSSLRDYIDRLHHEAGIKKPHRVILTCFPRLFGYVFNPIATYACWNDAGALSAVVYEVRNTFGEHHTYFFQMAMGAQDAVKPHECDKIFYVSPFMDMAARYRFLIEPPHDGAFSLKIIERDKDGVILTALMNARTFPATRAQLVRRLVATPLGGFKVMAGIHWQALRLWMRGHHVRPRPAPPAPVSHESTGPYSYSKPELSSVPHV